jgi:hypothetical protein
MVAQSGLAMDFFLCDRISSFLLSDGPEAILSKSMSELPWGSGVGNINGDTVDVFCPAKMLLPVSSSLYQVAGSIEHMLYIPR